MSIGKLYTYPGSVLTAKAQIAALYNGVEITVPAFEMGTENKTPEFLAKFPTGCVPAFEPATGGAIFESDAIAYYVASYKDNTKLLGSNKLEAAQIIQWAFFGRSFIAPATKTLLYPIWGFGAFNKADYTKAFTSLTSALKMLDAHLLHNTYLVGHHVTLADISVACELVNAYKFLFTAERRAEVSNVTRWFLTVTHQAHFKTILGDITLAVEEAKPLKKEKAAPAPKKVEAAAAAEEEEEAAPAPKAKNPLDLLPKSPFILDDWKRFYSNNDTKPTAMDYFWKHLDTEGFSVWRVDYKYNDELTKVFMSSNLIGGFFARLERARKYAFGSLLVLGEDNDSEIAGYFVVRGQEVPYEVYDAADYDSYKFTKVENLQDPATRELIGDFFAWEGKFGGGKQCADGKVFK